MLKLDLNPPRSQLREFGYVALVAFPVLGLVFHLANDLDLTYVFALLGLGLVCGALATFAETLLRPLFVLLMAIALPIGFVISHVLLSLIFFLLVFPLGLVFRLFGKDPLPKRPDPSLPTYWITRDKPRTPASYLRLY